MPRGRRKPPAQPWVPARVTAASDHSPLKVEQVVAVARVFAVPVQFVMGDDMYANWRRRVRRLQRARINAEPGRAAAIDRALRRLSTGSMQ